MLPSFRIRDFYPFPRTVQPQLQVPNLPQSARCDLAVPPVLLHDECPRLPLTRWRVGQTVLCLGWHNNHLYRVVWQANRQAETLHRNNRAFEYWRVPGDSYAGYIKRLL